MRNEIKQCSVCNSSKKVSYHNGILYCDKHYMQIRRHGEVCLRTRFDPNEIVLYANYAEIVLYNKSGEEVDRAVISLDDVEKCSKHRWHRHFSNRNKKYVVTHINKKMVRLHRIILEFYDMTLDIDHKDGNGLNNKRDNLIIATRQQNMMNQRKLPSNNTSGYMGVTFNKESEKWDAQLKFNGKHIYLGSFFNIEDAIIARRNGELEYFKEYKYSNFEKD